jgi:hypothetical protein
MKTELIEIKLIAKAIKIENRLRSERLKQQCDRIEELCVNLDNPQPKALSWKMKLYYKISLIAILVTYLTVFISAIMFGGDSIVPDLFIAFTAIVMVNFIVAMTLFVRDVITGKIKI